MTLKGPSVFVDPVKHDRGHRKHHPCWREFPLRKYVMNQAAMQPPVSVVKMMDIDKSKRRGRCLQDCIYNVCAHSIVRFQHSSHQILEVRRPCTDEFRQRVAVVIALAQKHTIWPQADAHKPLILYQYPLKPNDLIKSKLVFARLQNGPAPPLQPVARRPFAFDFKTGKAIHQKQEACRTGNEMRARAPQRFGRLLPKSALRKLCQQFRPSYDWTKSAAAEKVVPHAVAPRKTRLAREVRCRIKDINSRNPWIVRHIQ